VTSGPRIGGAIGRAGIAAIRGIAPVALARRAQADAA
jgi:hypothetical protein